MREPSPEGVGGPGLEGPGLGGPGLGGPELPTEDLGEWRRWWEGDLRFPIRSHRRFIGWLLVAWKRLLRPLVEAPQRDLWDRQRQFNLALLSHLAELARARQASAEETALLGRRLDEHEGALRGHVAALADQGDRLRRHEEKFAWQDGIVKGIENRLGHVEKVMARGLTEVMEHDDALFARVDQKLDRYRREARELVALLQGALAAAPAVGRPAAAVTEALAGRRYLELERLYRGTEEEVGRRLEIYLPHLAAGAATGGEVLDLGCGRGEALRLLAEHGIAARGVDASGEMVAHCRAQGFSVEQEDLFAALAATPATSLGGVVSFHVVEHLPAADVPRLVSLAWRALRAGGALVLETPNPLSVVVAARNFWRDPTHRRPLHPDGLELAFRQAGFTAVERLPLRPFTAEERLPELDLATLPPEQRELADRVNRLRDQLDELLFGYQDYALVGVK